MWSGNMIIKHAFITKFRALQNVEFDLGKKITAIVKWHYENYSFRDIKSNVYNQ